MTEDEVVRGLYDGIHDGTAGAGLPIPERGLKFEITEVSVGPILGKRPKARRLKSIAELLRMMAATSAEGLWVAVTDLPATATG
jgi:hypothetical protein